MTRTLAGSLATHLATKTTTLSRCVRLDLRDGATVATTDHDRDLSVNLGDGAQTYAAATGLKLGAISLSVGLPSDVVEIRGPVGDVVTRAAILGGRYDRARARIFDVNWQSTTSFARLLSGKVSGAKIEAGQFVFEVRSAADAFNQTIGRVFGPGCTHDLGDAQCTVTPASFGATVATVTDDMTFSVTWTGSVPSMADMVNGTVEFTSGALLGTNPMEIFAASGTTFTLYGPLAEAPTVGDALTVTEGCDKTRETCRDRFANMLNFGGFPDSPGSANYLKYAVPGTSA